MKLLLRRKINIFLDVNVRIEIIESITGQILDVIECHNLVTLAGRNLVRDFLNSLSPSSLSHFAIGTGTTAPTANDTGLQTEIFRDIFTKRTSSSGKLQSQYYLASSALNGNTLAEAGLFNAASGGTLFARVTYPGISKNSSIAITYTWDININAQ